MSLSLHLRLSLRVLLLLRLSLRLSSLLLLLQLLLRGGGGCNLPRGRRGGELLLRRQRQRVAPAAVGRVACFGKRRRGRKWGEKK